MQAISLEIEEILLKAKTGRPILQDGIDVGKLYNPEPHFWRVRNCESYLVRNTRDLAQDEDWYGKCCRQAEREVVRAGDWPQQHRRHCKDYREVVRWHVVDACW